MVFVPPDNTHLPQQVFCRFESVNKLYTEITAELVHQQSKEVTEDDPGVSEPPGPTTRASFSEIPSQTSIAVPQKVAAEFKTLSGNFDASFPDHDYALDENEDEDYQTQHS